MGHTLYLRQRTTFPSLERIDASFEDIADFEDHLCSSLSRLLAAHGAKAK